MFECFTLRKRMRENCVSIQGELWVFRFTLYVLLQWLE